MIEYDAGFWGVGFIWSLKGSVFPKALAWGLPSTLVTVLLNQFFPASLDMEGVDLVWSGYTFVLGFLVVFRNNEAYGRFWEGAALVHQVRGEWLNAVSSLVAFSSSKPEKQREVRQFQHLLVRLMSMMHCTALQMIADVEDNRFDIIHPAGLEKKCLSLLATCQSKNKRLEILIQWIQRVIVEAEREGAVQIAPPILSRVYHQLALGLVNLHNVRKIKDVPFPFPYAQMITCMMIFHGVLMPIIASQTFRSPTLAGLLTFATETAFWSLLYIALEIEQPFGEDMNDLPVRDMQEDFNNSLVLLLQDEVQSAPSLAGFRTSQHGEIFLRRSNTEVLYGDGGKKKDSQNSESAVRCSFQDLWNGDEDLAGLSKAAGQEYRKMNTVQSMFSQGGLASQASSREIFKSEGSASARSPRGNKATLSHDVAMDGRPMGDPGCLSCGGGGCSLCNHKRLSNVIEGTKSMEHQGTKSMGILENQQDNAAKESDSLFVSHQHSSETGRSSSAAVDVVPSNSGGVLPTLSDGFDPGIGVLPPEHGPAAPLQLNAMPVGRGGHCSSPHSRVRTPPIPAV